MNIYVSNIAFTLSESELESAFGAYGSVSSVKIIKDRDTGKSRGFGFVEMDNDNEGLEAIKNLNGSSIKGRDLQVKQAFPREK